MSVSTVQLPTLDDVVELMHGLFDLEITKSAPSTSEIYSIAEYKDENDAPVGYIACDLAGGCNLGAALTQVPAGRVDEAVSEGAMPESLAENLDEVLNISVNLMASADGSRVILNRCVHGSQSADYAAMNDALESLDKTEFCFEIARYGVCRLIIAS